MGYVWSWLAAAVIACTGGASVWALSAAQSNADTEIDYVPSAYITAGEIGRGIASVSFSVDRENWVETYGGEINTRIFMLVLLEDGFEYVNNKEIKTATKGAGYMKFYMAQDNLNTRIFSINLKKAEQIVTIGNLPTFYSTTIEPTGDVVAVVPSVQRAVKNDTVDYEIKIAIGYKIENVTVTGGTLAGEPKYIALSTHQNLELYRITVEKITANVEMEIVTVAK